MTLWHKPVAALIIALAVVAAGCSDSGNESSRRDHDDEREQGGRARHARLLRDPQAGEGRLRAGERAQADDPAGRRRRRDGQPGAPDEGESPGRRSLRDRQQPALAGARRGPVRALRGRLPRVRRCALPDRPNPCGDPDRPRRCVPQRRPDVVRLARNCTAADARRPDAAALQGSARRREPGHLDARAGLHARHHREVRRGRLAGLLAPAADERRARRRRLGGGVYDRSSPAPAAARGSGRSSSPTPRARRPR